MAAHSVKMVSNTRVSFFIKYLRSYYSSMHYEYLLFKGIQSGYFYTTHFYKAKIT